jgi:hypothetical protein
MFYHVGAVAAAAAAAVGAAPVSPIYCGPAPGPYGGVHMQVDLVQVDCASMMLPPLANFLGGGITAIDMRCHNWNKNDGHPPQAVWGNTPSDCKTIVAALNSRLGGSAFLCPSSDSNIVSAPPLRHAPSRPSLTLTHPRLMNLGADRNKRCQGQPHLPGEGRGPERRTRPAAQSGAARHIQRAAQVDPVHGPVGAVRDDI